MAVEETFAALVREELEDASRTGTDPLGAHWRRHIDGMEGGDKHKRVCARCACAGLGAEAGALGRAAQIGRVLTPEAVRELVECDWNSAMCA